MVLHQRSLVPLQIDVFGDVIDLEVGYEHTCALMVTQTVTCCGRNDRPAWIRQ